MILVDTSVWAEHIRSGLPSLRAALENGEVMTHDFVIGELLLGHIKRGAAFMLMMDLLPRAATCEHDEIRALVRSARLEGTGIGWVDAHVLASCRLAGAALWTLDRAQQAAAARAQTRVV